MALTEAWLLEKANRRLNEKGMLKEVSDKTRAVIKEMAKQGIYINVAQGFRSIAEQNELYAQGRTKPGNVVTNAKGGQSNHNYGVAVDLCQYTQDGKDVIWAVDAKFKKIVAAMKKQGFKWGGDWKSFKDNPHFELYDWVGGERPNSRTPAKPSKPSTPAKPSGELGLVDYMNSKKMDSSFANRKVLAGKYGIKNYTGTASQNTQLLAKIKAGAPKPATPKPPAKPATSGMYVYFPAGKGTWSVYPLNKAPVKANAIGAINPSKFGGLTYKVEKNYGDNVLGIKTGSFGHVKVYCHPSTGVKISNNGAGNFPNVQN
ncbi:endolysin, L-alanyl-D-glutamate peptidase [Listeria phage LP-KV022]|uniref:Endolysin, L-alanyl-D-glutamate peptidase n=5 Tax=Homburgvirus TaxID=1921125 RepID=A0A5A4K5A1_9CAUD|nr:ferredoxin [Listeria phage LP-110]YP_008240572.1 ferredoxin [Listeria phage LP-037]YP_009045157.1 ferredoxin [Listeria phage LP-114]AWY07648.1 endolysin, L-alanyl-D-glutamate peptidase [Listeria phage LP-KV022]QDK04847.1 N-acetylmuramoyl-L-alanine amidase [Listeria phage LP-031]AGI11569.1 putative endolysin [Listeria phage LP-110]AGI11709.1 putative endolysin [Listeria phage LP-037]AHL18691.1 putative endolysin [Listeria phage LP-114]